MLDWVHTVAWYVGLAVLAKWSLCWIRSLATLAWQPIKLANLGEFAVVTGATDGIGKEFVFALAKKGISLLLVGRNDSKLEQVVREVKEKCPKFEGKIMIACVDFAKDGEKGYEELRQLIEPLNIGLLINNVGVGYPHPLYVNETPVELIEDMINVNIRPMYRLTKLVIPQMEMQKKGMIVCTSSGAGCFPTEPFYSYYSSSKGAALQFCDALKTECAEKRIIVQCHTPLLVTTKMSKCKTPNWMTPSASEYVRAAIKKMERGHSATCSPYRMHSAILAVAGSLPAVAWRALRTSSIKALRSRALKKNKSS